MRWHLTEGRLFVGDRSNAASKSSTRTAILLTRCFIQPPERNLHRQARPVYVADSEPAPSPTTTPAGRGMRAGASRRARFSRSFQIQSERQNTAAEASRSTKKHLRRQWGEG
jgi:hypothetical protein